MYSMMSSIPVDLSLRLMAAVDSMPAFPKNVQRILVLTSNLACSPKELVQLIGKDPVMTIKVLRVVNSAYYGLLTKITSIDHAVVFLGFNTIKNLALSMAAISMLPGNPLAGFDGQRYLVHSLTVAAVARRLAQQLSDSDPNDCFIAGLLHDFGKVVVAQFMPAQFRKALEMSLWHDVALHLALREVLGVDHAAVGAMLAEKWRFAQNLVDTIRFQHAPDQCDTSMMACVFAANQIGKQLGFDLGGCLVAAPLPDAVAARLGGKLDSVVARLGDLTPLFEEAQLFANV